MGINFLRRSWPAIMAVLAIGALGTWLRTDQLLSQTLLEDEWHSIHQVIRSAPRQFLFSLGVADYSIPLTLLYWGMAETVGLSELGMRLPSLLCGLGTLLVVPWALRGRLSLQTTLLLAAMLALSPLLVGYSQMARPYALTLPLTIGALALAHAATSAQSVRWRFAIPYGWMSGLAVWLHAVTLPFVLAPLIALGLNRLRYEGPSWRELAALAALTLAPVALALLPPLLNDPNALASKSGDGLPNLATLRGVWHVWLGTSSGLVVALCLVVASVGAPKVWRESRVARWTVLGLALTATSILLVRPAWVFNPLTLGRYLLPALPLLWLCTAAGIDRIGHFAGRGHPIVVSVMGTLFALSVWFTSIHPELTRYPNTNGLHYYYQFDFRPDENPVVEIFDRIPNSSFWASLRNRPPGSVNVAVAPFRFDGARWLAPNWEKASGQRVVPAFLSGACEPWLWGEVPLGPRFALRNAVHLADATALAEKRIDFVAFYRKAKVLDMSGAERESPGCEAWMRQRFGQPSFEDADLVVWPATARQP